MTSLTLPPFEVVQRELVLLALGVDAEELHGSLCGFLVAGGRCNAKAWPEQLAFDAIDSARLADDAPLGSLYRVSVAQLGDVELGFQLLIPDDAPLNERAEKLVAWCRGFLGGFGLAQGRTYSADADEALADLGRIAATALTFEDPEQDAESLEELIEFVRVAVLLLGSDDDGAARDNALPHPASTLH